MKKENEQLVALVDISPKKLDYYTIERFLIDERGKATTAGNNLKLLGLGVYKNRNSDQVYDLLHEIDFVTGKKNTKKGTAKCEYSRVILGQSGAFLKVAIDTPYVEVERIRQILQPLAEICKLCAFRPYAVAHYSDGDYFVSKEEYDQTVWKNNKGYEIIEGAIIL